MTPMQFRRWSSFSTKMAREAWPNATGSRKDRLVEEIEAFLTRMEPHMAEITDWDGNSEPSFCVDDEIRDYCYDAGYTHHDPDQLHRFETQFICCVRAGFDVAVKPSAGVLGFDIAMLKRMWHGRIPPWVRLFFDPPLTTGFKDEDPVWL